MNLKRKIEIIDTAIKSLATHDDVSQAEMKKAMQDIREIVNKYEREAVARRKANG